MADAGFRADQPITDPEGRDRVESRARLSESMLDTRPGADRVVPAAAGDRSQLMSDVGKTVESMNKTLGDASDAMKAFNVNAQSGQLKPGSPEYIQAFQKAAEGYRAAINQAAGQLFQKDAQGQPVPSDLSRRVDQEQKTLETEKNALRELAKGGQTQLTQEQMQRLGVNTADVREAFKQKVQQSMVLDDFQRSLAYAQSNFGMALIRSTATMPAQIKAAQIGEGEKLIQSAAQLNPQMLRDENFWAHYQNVYQKVGVAPKMAIPAAADRPAAPGDRPLNPSDQPVNPGTAPSTSLRFNLPSGNVRPDSPGFVDPHTLIRNADQSVTGPLTTDNLKKYDAAIAAADALDRNYLRQVIDGQKAALKARVDGDQSGQLRLRVQAQGNLLEALPNMDARLETQKATVAQAVGGDSLALFNAMQSQTSTANLQQFMQQEQTAIAAIKQNPQAAQLITSIQQRVAVRDRLTTLEGEIKQIDPQYAGVYENLQRNMRLNMSSLDARAHTLRAILPSIQENPANADAARQLMIQMAQMDKGRLQMTDFQKLARDLGLTREQLTGAAAGPQRPGSDDTNSDIRVPAKVGDQATPPEKAAALYRQVLDHAGKGQPITEQEEKAFEELIKDAGSLNQDGVREQAGRLRTRSAALGQGKTVEERLQELSAPGSQQKLADYKAQPDIKDYLADKFRFNMAVHGEKVVEGLYGLALMRATNDAEKLKKAGLYLTDANLNQFAQSVLPLNEAINALSQGRPQPGDRGVRPSAAMPTDAAAERATAPGADDPRWQAVPGYRELERAATVIAGNTNDPVGSLKRAQADFEQSIKLSAQINPAAEQKKIDDAAAQIQRQRAELAMLSEQQKQANPQGTLEKVNALAALVNDAEMAKARSSQGTQARMTYAAALNHAAVALYAQGDGKRAEADAYNARALELMREIPKVDATYGEGNPQSRDIVKRLVDGSIQQAEQRQKIVGTQAISGSFARDAIEKLNFGQTFRGLTGLQPVAAMVNLAGPVGEIAGVKTFSSFTREAAADDLASARMADAKAADAAVEEEKRNQRTGLVHGAIDLIAGPGSVFVAEKLAPKLLSFLPVNPLVKGAVSLAVDALATRAMDKGASALWGTNEFSDAEWYSHTAASWGSSWAIRGAMSLRSTAAASALETGVTTRAAGSLAPKATEALRLTEGASEATRAAEYARGVAAVRSEATAGFNAARSAEYGWYNPQRYLGNVTVTEKMRAANLVGENLPAVGEKVSKAQWVATTGIENGSVFNYLRPSNIGAGFMQRTLEVGAEGKVVGTAQDLAARQMWSRIAPAAVTGGVATGIYGTAETNFWFKNNSVEQTLQAAGTNALAGSIAAGVATPLLPAVGKLIAMPYRFVADGSVGIAKWLAPKTSAAVAESPTGVWVRNAGSAVSNRVGAARDWMTGGAQDVGTLLQAPASTQNFANLYSRGYAPALALPLAATVTSGLTLREWDAVDTRSQEIVAARRAQQEKLAADLRRRQTPGADVRPASSN